MMTLYFHFWQNLMRGWSYFHSRQYLGWVCWVRVIILWLYIFTPDNIWWGDDYIVTYFHPWQYLVRGCIVTLYFHSWQYLVRGWLYRDIFSLLTISGEEGDYIVTLYFLLLTISGEGVIISWHHIFTPDNIWWGGDYIVTLHFHFWNSRIRHWRWLYLNIFTIQIWLCSDTRVLSFIYNTYIHLMKLGVEVIIFKHDTLFAVETYCFGWIS